MSIQPNTAYKSKITDVLSKQLGTHSNTTLYFSWLDTPLDPILAIGDETSLCLLEFIGKRNLESEIEKLMLKTKAAIIPGSSHPIVSIEKELKAYFKGELKEFKTPLYIFGSPFQKQAWEALMRIPYGQTRSYLDQAISIGKPSSVRAVANANGANQLAIVIPCHRIINTNGNLGGYSGGIEHKKWLIEHEKRFEKLSNSK